MNKVIDYGFTGSFFTNDVEAVSDIKRDKIHDLNLSDYMDKNKEGVLKDYLKDVPEDELYLITAYISEDEFPEDEYILYGNEEGKKLIPVDEILERENSIMEDAGFVNVNDYVDYEYKTAFIYPNEAGKKVIEAMKQSVAEWRRNHKRYYAINIEWDLTDADMTEEEEADVLSILPKKMRIPDCYIDESGVDSEAVSDWISDETGCCHAGFEIQEENV